MNKIIKQKVISYICFLSGFFLVGCQSNIDDKISQLKKSIDSLETEITKEKSFIESSHQDKNIQKNDIDNNHNISLNIKNKQ